MKQSAETLLEIFIDENEKLKKLILKQHEQNEALNKMLSSASSYDVKTDRLEEVIKYWNELFTKQKAQILELKKNEVKGHKKEESKTFKLLIVIIVLLLINLIYLIWN